jgi:hypothetical protein
VVEDAGVTVTTSAELTVLADGWTVVDLGAAANVTKATLDGRPCPLSVRKGRLAALVENAGRKKLEIVYEAALGQTDVMQSFSVPLLPAPGVQLSARLPGIDLLVNVPGATSVRQVENRDKTTSVSCGLPGTKMARVSWRPRPPKQKALPPLICADTETLVSVQEGLVRCLATVRFHVLRSPIREFRVVLPVGFELADVAGPKIRDHELTKRGETQTLRIELERPVLGNYELTVTCDRRFKDGEAEIVTATVTPTGVVRDRGSMAVEVYGPLQVLGTPKRAVPTDVKLLPRSLWRRAGAPLVLAYRYVDAGAFLLLQVTKHQGINVLVAMSDFCEAATVVTPSGKVITKMMYVLRNNQKQHMALELPEGAQVWSVFVDDRPVAAARDAKGRLLIPLRKSEETDDQDDSDGKSYRARREKRRRPLEPKHQRIEQARRLDEDRRPRDLKPYDVELVFVSPPLKLEARGDLKLALPKSDVPCGLMAWATLLPKKYRVVDVAGNCREVENFALPFRHFADDKLAKLEQASTTIRQLDSLQEMQKAAEALDQTFAAAATARGALPVRVELPVAGGITRLQKYLAVDEAPAVTVTYRRRPD